MNNNCKVVVFDIDGTLADISHRRHFVTEKKKDWNSFNNAMIYDKPNHAIVELYLALFKQYHLILVSGRTDNYLDITVQWLKKYNIPFNEIHMRKYGDYRADSIVKEEILKKLLNKGYQILFAVDDRQQVVDMWRRNGITCLQCDYGDF